MSDISYMNSELADGGGYVASAIARFSTLTEPEAYELVMDFIHKLVEDHAPKNGQEMPWLWSSKADGERDGL